MSAGPKDASDRCSPLRRPQVCRLAATLRKRIFTLPSVPVQVRITLRTAFRAELQLVADESSADSSLRGWKLFFIAVRIPTAELERRCEAFRRGEWPCPFAAAQANP